MKWYRLLCLILSLLLLSSCTFTKQEPTEPTQGAPSHSLAAYTMWIGHPMQEVENALGNAETVDFMGLTFSRLLLSEEDFFSGVELTCQLNDTAGKVADTVWNLTQEMDGEYMAVDTSHQNMYSDTEQFANMEKEEYLGNLEKALELRGAYVFDVSWMLLLKFQTDESRALLERMGERVLEETEQLYKDSGIDYVWSVKKQLDLTLQVTIWNANRADVKVTCKALAEPAAGMDMDVEDRGDRFKKFFKVSYERLLAQQNLCVLGYSFRTAQNYKAKTWEEIYRHGDDFLYIVDSNNSQTIYLQTDGIQYKTVYRHGAYSPWEVLTNPIAHPLPWVDTEADIVDRSYDGGGYTGNIYQNIFEASPNLEYDGMKADFWTRANSIYKAEYIKTEEVVVSGDYVTTEYRRVLDISVVTEQEAAAAIEKYKAMLP